MPPGDPSYTKKPQNTNSISCNSQLDVLGELAFVGLIILFRQVSHIVSNVLTKDVLAVDIGVEFLGFSIETRESLGTKQKRSRHVNRSFHNAQTNYSIEMSDH